MRQVSEDRRTRKTKAALENALAELIQKKDINKITIRDITDKADTNRSTFYTHYEDIYDLLRVLEDKLIDRIKGIHASAPLDENNKYRLIDTLQYIQDNKSLFSAILRSSKGPDFMNRVTEVVGKEIMELMDNVPDNSMLLRFYTHGSVSVIREWVNNACEELSAEQMCMFLENVFRSGMNMVPQEAEVRR